MFCRRGFNIDSLTVSATNDPTVSRITVSVSGTEKEDVYKRQIEAKETGFVRDFTNLFLLEHSIQTPELWLRTDCLLYTSRCV